MPPRLQKGPLKLRDYLFITTPLFSQDYIRIIISIYSCRRRLLTSLFIGHDSAMSSLEAVHRAPCKRAQSPVVVYSWSETKVRTTADADRQ